MRRIKYTFGLDFGTSKTAISFAQADVINPQVVDVAIHGSDDRIPTCVLYDKVRDRFHVGDIAEQEYLLARDPAERAAMTFFANFKPHIGRSAEHRETALRFLQEVRRAERLAEKIDLAGSEGVVEDRKSVPGGDPIEYRGEIRDPAKFHPVTGREDHMVGHQLLPVGQPDP